MNFRDWTVGMKVICVDAGGWPRLRNGATYEISAIGEAFGQIYVGLVETTGRSDLHWRASRFRPVQPRKTDISIFTAILKGADRRVSA